MENLSDTRDIGDVGLDSEGFPSDYDPKTVRGIPDNDSKEDYQKDGSSYEAQDEVREWETQGKFGPKEEVFEVFSQVMDSPVEELEEGKVMTDGGVPNGSPFYREEDEQALSQASDEEPYTDGGRPTLADVDHEGPYGDFEEGGAPW